MVTEIGKKVQNFYNKTPFPDYELERFNSKNDLETACRTWWAYTNTGVDNSALPQLTIASGQIYTVAIKNANFKTEAAIAADRWDFSMIFIVAGKL